MCSVNIFIKIMYRIQNKKPTAKAENYLANTQTVKKIKIDKRVHEISNTPISYMLCLFCKKPIGELKLESLVYEATGVFLSSFSSSSPLG